MPICVACGEWTNGPLCLPCRRLLKPGRSGVVGDIAVSYAFHHSATGRVLVHRLKYHGLSRAADILSAAMAPLVPSAAAVLVPVPRSPVRRVTYGVDPAKELARRLGRLLDVPVVAALGPPLWWPRHAGRDMARRSAPAFSARKSARKAVAGGVVLVDDVITSGATLKGAVAVLDGPILAAISATSPGMMVVSKAPIASRRLRDSTAPRHRWVESRS
jgi:predicted amidophosphoribosyltransferase